MCLKDCATNSSMVFSMVHISTLMMGWFQWIVQLYFMCLITIGRRVKEICVEVNWGQLFRSEATKGLPGYSSEFIHLKLCQLPL